MGGGTSAEGRARKIWSKNGNFKNRGVTTMYRICISSFNGLSFTGVTAETEEEARALCDKYNNQDNTPCCTHVYRKV